MKRDAFLRRLRRIARAKGLEISISGQGKGSHMTIRLGGRGTTVPKEVKEPGGLNAILKQLGLTREDWTS